MINVGVIGLMGYGSTYFKTFKELPCVTVRSLCDANSEVLEKVAQEQNVALRFTDYKEMLRDNELDAVFIATPHFLHYQMTMDALNAGKHVFCEKPLAMNGKEAEEMTSKAREKGLVLSCHYNRRQSAVVKLLKDLMEKEVLGEVYAANVKWMARYTSFMFSPDSAWRTKKDKAGGGILIGRGSHMIDAVLHILGKPKIKSISANICSRLTGLEIDDYCLIVMRTENGSSITVECSYENNIPNYSEKIEYQLFGTKAGAYCKEENKETQCNIGYCKFPENEWVDLSDKYLPESYAETYPTNIIVDFLQALNNNKAPMISGDDAANITKIIDSAYASAEKNCEILL